MTDDGATARLRHVALSFGTATCVIVSSTPRHPLSTDIFCEWIFGQRHSKQSSPQNSSSTYIISCTSTLPSLSRSQPCSRFDARRCIAHRKAQMHTHAQSANKVAKSAVDTVSTSGSVIHAKCAHLPCEEGGYHTRQVGTPRSRLMRSGGCAHVVVERPAHVDQRAVVAAHLRVDVELEEEARLDGDPILHQRR